MTIRPGDESVRRHTQALTLDSISRKEISRAGGIYSAPVDGVTIRIYEDANELLWYDGLLRSVSKPAWRSIGDGSVIGVLGSRFARGGTVSYYLERVVKCTYIYFIVVVRTPEPLTVPWVK